MRKRFRGTIMLLGACALAAAVLTVFYAFYPMEPSFEGKRLSQWAVIAHDKDPGLEKEKARAVVRRLAGNSIPLLLDWLRTPNSPSWNERIFNLKCKVSPWLVAHHIIKNRPITLIGGGLSRRTIAEFALAELDPAGKKVVIPVLIQRLGDKKHKPDEISETAGMAFLVLPMLAPESIAPLIDALSSHDVQVWSLAEGALGKIGPNAKAAIPVLEKRLKDNDVIKKVGVAETIGNLGGDPRKFIPVVIQSLPEMNWDCMDYSLGILVRYKDEAKAAVPILLTILSKTPESSNPTNAMVRGAIINALREINSEAITKAGAR